MTTNTFRITPLWRKKNKEVSEKLRMQPSLYEDSFKRGMRDFFKGERRPIVFSPSQFLRVVRRNKAFNRNDFDTANKIANDFFSEGVYLIDYYEPGQTALIETTAEITVQASNPYRKDTLNAKEWERGFNAGYYLTLERINRKKTNSREWVKGRNKETVH